MLNEKGGGGYELVLRHISPISQPPPPSTPPLQVIIAQSRNERMEDTISLDDFIQPAVK